MTKFDDKGNVIGHCSCKASDRYEMWECLRGYCGGRLIPIKKTEYYNTKEHL